MATAGNCDELYRANVSTCALMGSLEKCRLRAVCVDGVQIKLQRIKMLERVQDEVRHTAIP